MLVIAFGRCLLLQPCEIQRRDSKKDNISNRASWTKYKQIKLGMEYTALVQLLGEPNGLELKNKKFTILGDTFFDAYLHGIVEHNGVIGQNRLLIWYGTNIVILIRLDVDHCVLWYTASAISVD